jgi:hypothetical protein
MKPITKEQARARYDAALPERIRRLDRELAIERVKDFDTLAAKTTRGNREYVFKINVFRNGGQGFSATTKVNGRVSRYNGDIPSAAYGHLIHSLRWAVDQMNFEANEAAYAERKRQEAAYEQV